MGNVVREGGRVERTSGTYLPWARNRSVIGAVGDTILLLTLTDGKLWHFLPSEEPREYKLDRTIFLRRYFEPPEMVEDVVSYPWVQVGGELLKLNGARAIRTGSFGPSGRVYLIRPYSAVWHDYQDDVFEIDGGWEEVNFGMEVYDRQGIFLGAWLLPDNDISWLRVDRQGRLFLGTPKRILVAEDPIHSGNRCPPFSGPVILKLLDRPHGY
jgi:hypothetical protein